MFLLTSITLNILLQKKSVQLIILKISNFLSQVQGTDYILYKRILRRKSSKK